MTITILKVVLVIVIICVMILLLSGISHLSSGNFGTDQSEIDDLRDDLDNRYDVITDQSIFRELVKVRHTAGHRSADKLDELMHKGTSVFAAKRKNF